jgi:hypothetical protein
MRRTSQISHIPIRQSRKPLLNRLIHQNRKTLSREHAHRVVGVVKRAMTLWGPALGVVEAVI